MFADKENAFVDTVRALLLTCSLSMLSGCQDPAPQISAPDAIKLGHAGDATFYLKEFQGKTLLVFDGIEANGVIEHHAAGSSRENKSGHEFQVSRLAGAAGDGCLYHLKVDGADYIFVDGISSGGITRLAPNAD